MTDILIIEDEAKAARELSNMLKHIDDSINVLAILDSIEQSIQWFSGNAQPHLILSDIQLADGLCFEIFQKVNIKSPVIFCTAFDEYLMNAFDTNAVSYLLKPVTRNKLEIALEKYHTFKSVFEKENTVSNLNSLLQQLKYNYKSALLVYQKDKIIPVQVKDIACIYLNKTMLNISTMSGHKYYLSSTLDDVENMLDPSMFCRANRQFLINKAAIINAERFFARKLTVKLIVETTEPVIVSKAKASEFLQWLEGI